MRINKQANALSVNMQVTDWPTQTRLTKLVIFCWYFWHFFFFRFSLPFCIAFIVARYLQRLYAPSNDPYKLQSAHRTHIQFQCRILLQQTFCWDLLYSIWYFVFFVQSLLGALALVGHHKIIHTNASKHYTINNNTNKMHRQEICIESE